MSRSKVKHLACWLRRMVQVGFVLSVLAYIGLFILPTVFGLQVVAAPRRDIPKQVSLYYLRHVQPIDIRVGDTLVYVDEVGQTQTTAVSRPVEGMRLPTVAGQLKYGQALGVPRYELAFLGEFYDWLLSANGRRGIMIYVVGVVSVLYLLSFAKDRKKVEGVKVVAHEAVVVDDEVASEEVAVLPLESDEPKSEKQKSQKVMKLISYFGKTVRFKQYEGRHDAQ